MSTKKFVFILAILSIITSGIAVFVSGMVLGFNPLDAIFGLNLKEINDAIAEENYDEAERLYIEKIKESYDIELVRGLTEVQEMKEIKKDLEEVDKLVEEENTRKAFEIVKEMKANNKVETLEYEIEEKYDELRNKEIVNLKKGAQELIDKNEFIGDRYTYHDGYEVKNLFKKYPNESESKEIIKKYVVARNSFFDAKDKAAEAKRIEEEKKKKAAQDAAAKKKAENEINKNRPLTYKEAEKLAKELYKDWIFESGDPNLSSYMLMETPEKYGEKPCYNFVFYDPEEQGTYIVRMFTDGQTIARFNG
ncbi:MAG: hypothetical protein ACRCWM_04265 [Sarcina sp.]